MSQRRVKSKLMAILCLSSNLALVLTQNSLAAKTFISMAHCLAFRTRKWTKCMTKLSNLPNLSNLWTKSLKTIPPACKFALHFQLRFALVATFLFSMRSSLSAMLLSKRSVTTTFVLLKVTKLSYLSPTPWKTFASSVIVPL